jgi:hypothetical protein
MVADGEMESQDRAPTAKQLFEDGRREFLAGRYFEAHDIWEELWHRLRGPDRRYLQGLIHLAVGAYHYGNGNAAGARSQWEKAVRKLGEYPACHWGVDASGWVRWIGAYLEGNSPEPMPAHLPFQPERLPLHLPLASD